MENFKKFEDIEVKLVGSIASPYELAVATARTCYSGKGVIFPENVSATEKDVAMRDRIAASTLEAGHLTTRQHAHFVFAMSGVSRQLIWSFLHSHPFYNSEQVSQRYVRVKRGSFVMPPLPEKVHSIYGDAIQQQMDAYERLIEILKVPLGSDFYERFPGRRKQTEKWESSILKRSYEVARYVLGVGTTAYLYHTVSALTLLRYARLCNQFDTPAEQKIVVKKMLDCVREIDPLFEKEIEDPFPLEKTLEYQQVSRFRSGPRHSVEFVRGDIEVLLGPDTLVTKVLLSVCFMMVIRWTIPRFRFDQLMDLGWKGLFPIAVANVLVTALALAFFER